MKKTFFGLLAISLAALMMFSCSSSKNDNVDPSNPKDLLDLPYSTLSPADQKKKLSQEGEGVIKLMEDLPNDKALLLLESFALKSDLFFDAIEEGRTGSDLTKTIVKLSQYYGEYEWDLVNKDWVKTDSKITDKLVIILPATKTETKNNGKLEVTAIASTVVVNDREIPSNVLTNIFVDNKKEGEIAIVATGINESTFAETAKIDADLSMYKLITNIDKKGGENIAKGTWSKNTQSILDFYADLEASITLENLQEEDVTSTIKDGNARITITDDLAAAGFFDGKSYFAEMAAIEDAEEAIYEKYNYYDDKNKREARAKEELELEKRKVKAMNDFTNLALVSVKEEYKIAKISVELETKEVSKYGYTYDKGANGDYDWSTGKSFTYTGYNTNEIYILHFDDNTKVEASVFFGEGFAKIVKMWEDFTAQFN